MEQTEENLYKILLGIQEKIGEMSSDIKSTLAQTIKTNGRVTALEGEMVKRKEFEDTWKGKIAIIGIVLGFVGAFISAWLRERLSL